MRVVLAEDSVLLREGLIRLLAEGGAEVLAAVEDGDALTAAVSTHEPDVVITDVRMPPSFSDEGLRAAAAIRQSHPGIGILVLSQYVELTYASDLMAGASVAGAGGVGYLLKDRISRLEDMMDALVRVKDGGMVLDPEVVAAAFNRRDGNSVSLLTPREREVLQLMAEGRTNAAIARQLTLSAGGVEKNISSIFTKMDLPPHLDDHRRVLAVLNWVRNGR
ncbi:response regulator transcription factor [Arthrobacter parietis]|uniref:Response regulator transcription factor n=1 Tax=Arthrobacter parietis TaxID=271434 RepID=A0ABN3ALU8_9MICC